jgi:hypothetical protein
MQDGVQVSDLRQALQEPRQQGQLAVQTLGSMAVFCHLTPRGSLRKSTLRKAPSMWQGENIRVPKIVGG